MIQDDQECGGNGTDPTATLEAYLPRGSNSKIYHFSHRPCSVPGAHRDFMAPEGVALWGDDVLAFFSKNGAPP